MKCKSFINAKKTTKNTKSCIIIEINLIVYAAADAHHGDNEFLSFG